jgi:hypothetical protein
MWGVRMLRGEVIACNALNDFRAIMKDKMDRIVKRGWVDDGFFDDYTCEEIWQIAIERVLANLPYILKEFNPIIYYLCGEDTYTKEVYKRVKAGESIDDVVDELAATGLLRDFLNKIIWKVVDDVKNDRTSFIKHLKQFSQRPSWNSEHFYESQKFGKNEDIELTKADFKKWLLQGKNAKEWNLLVDALNATCHDNRSRDCILLLLAGKSISEIGTEVELKSSQVHDVIRDIYKRASEYGRVPFAPDPVKAPEPEFVRKPVSTGRQKIPYT